MDGATRLFPIIGSPIAHVQSPRTLTDTLTERGRNAVCIPLEVTEGRLDAAMTGLTAAENVDGILVTMPHKFAAFAYCATSTERARLFGVVSVMRRNPDGTWHGDMLDGVAFVEAQKARGASIAGGRALLVGAGGAGSAIAQALIADKVGELVIRDRDAGRTRELVARLEGATAGPEATRPVDPSGFDLVFNATSSGLAPDDPSSVDADLLTDSMFVGDVIATDGTSALIAAARARGCATADGHDMVDAVQQQMADFLLGR